MTNLSSAILSFIVGIFMLIVGWYFYAVINLSFSVINGLIAVRQRKELDNPKEVI